ncbi:helix-turn-helix transcriptional regulator [Alkalihalobacillus sp. AL-G]|uniref:helix-turn-helix transcriptional regulator n=1 Tax=Alkalihalobacillus sp. AL-G TaxID=2926399 RepID=UPI0027299FB6|nr:transcriptional regulator [Alkalihalobacillus sp. AL-G]WLD92737.1 transcriptional regulator [Alkalihalobacillus sp. AL-G]
MTIEQITEIISNKLKLIRIEKGYTQDRMAIVLGLSKKTLVQIEKHRNHANWTTIVAICALFRDSEILRTAVGGDPVELVEILAHEGIERPKDRTLGGKVWWKDLKVVNNYRLQQNMISKHFRILDQENHRWYSSFDEDEAHDRLAEFSTSES